MKTYFISGHRQVSTSTLAEYEKIITDISNAGDARFVLGDFHGVDEFAQKLLGTLNKAKLAKGETPSRVLVYHLGEIPRNNPCGFPTVGGFVSDHERDSAMTLHSEYDIAIVEEGKAGSGTHQNIVRRLLLSTFKAMPRDQAISFASSLVVLAKVY